MTVYTMLSPAASGTYVQPIPQVKNSRGIADLTGETFGRLTVLGFSHLHQHPSGKRGAYWYAVCSCGSGVRAYSRDALRSGDAQSCGCWHKERARTDSGKRKPLSDLTYNGLHRRVVRVHGKATEHTCVDCGKQAHEWSYEGDGTRRSGYSNADLALFKPRCRKCHRNYDADRRKAA